MNTEPDGQWRGDREPKLKLGARKETARLTESTRIVREFVEHVPGRSRREFQTAIMEGAL